ncbi:cyclin dependent kinase inhibitor 1Bb [Corythoichthys intestinalis]|uniref:cyclin dependent kinase inhibitor 1Bb n=1 Tax=Corythoichthys intestinalis TaxID=161448 RepID=UPI0025A671B5|nr:cyclin dependent kinase inhibitor 1Bb [Corythoichthys intestinalis]XP_061813361.1 cyclin dependent kinase inhibitor 1Bb [Nerophis lumbriciformis]
MSDVRLSSGSPTLERSESRLSVHPKPSACRNLFGSVDHDELRRDLKEHLRELEEAAAAKWSFDFASDDPLENDGGLRWELVDCRDVPDFYTRPPRTGRGATGYNGVDVNGNHRCVVVPPADERTGGPTSCPEQCTPARKRPACPEPSTQSKRSHSSPSECPNRSRSSEHTPRKSSGSPGRQT